uniref:Nucleolar protein 8 n=1 Tax=Strigops habroptila TaxID=2489341 RepID=A0A672UC76_STRHB
METEQVLKRLYVGGLAHEVSKAELQERFGKFGHVLDTEIITRQDDQGTPLKTFAYISVSISDADLRKCMSVLNETKWKGGTLQIQLAKESFLHRNGLLVNLAESCLSCTLGVNRRRKYPFPLGWA